MTSGDTMPISVIHGAAGAPPARRGAVNTAETR